MNLLFDQNLSPRLVNRLSDLYPDSQHASFIGLDQAVVGCRDRLRSPTSDVEAFQD